MRENIVIWPAKTGFYLAFTKSIPLICCPCAYKVNADWPLGIGKDGNPMLLGL